MISNTQLLLLPSTLAEANFVVDKELTADDEEQNHTRDNVRKRLIQPELRGYFASAAVKENEQEAGKNHNERVKFRQP